MAEFVWEARARTGELRKGNMEADDAEAVGCQVAAILGRAGLQLVARSRQRKEVLEEWTPRAGQSILV